MNITQTLTPATIVQELIEWEEIIRDLWPARLPTLDMANIWRMPDNGAISGYSLVFRTPGNNTHHNTDWFLIDPYTDEVVRHNQQHKLYEAVQPAAGLCDMLWNRNGTWYTMATSPYVFNIKKDHVTGRMVNNA